VKEAIEINKERTSAAWVEVNHDQYFGRLVEDCNVEEVRGDFDMRLIIEYYSR
jgi:ribosomal protein S4